MIRKFSIQLCPDQAEAMALVILDGVDLCRETGNEVSIVKLPTTYIASAVVTEADALEYCIPLYITAETENGFSTSTTTESGGNLIDFASSHEKANKKA